MTREEAIKLVRDWAAQDRENWVTLGPDDFETFKKLCVEEGIEGADWELFSEYIDVAEYGLSEDESDNEEDSSPNRYIITVERGPDICVVEGAPNEDAADEFALESDYASEILMYEQSRGRGSVSAFEIDADDWDAGFYKGVPVLVYKDENTNESLEEGMSPDQFKYLTELANSIGITTMGELEEFCKHEIPEYNGKWDDDVIEALVQYRKSLGPDFKIKEDIEEDDMSDLELAEKLEAAKKAKKQLEEGSDHEKGNDQVCVAADPESSIKDPENAVVDCKTHTVITHSEDEKPVDCKMEKKPLEKPLTEAADKYFEIQYYDGKTVKSTDPEEVSDIIDQAISCEIDVHRIDLMQAGEFVKGIWDDEGNYDDEGILGAYELEAMLTESLTEETSTDEGKMNACLQSVQNVATKLAEEIKFAKERLEATVKDTNILEQFSDTVNSIVIDIIGLAEAEDAVKRNKEAVFGDEEFSESLTEGIFDKDYLHMGIDGILDSYKKKSKVIKEYHITITYKDANKEVASQEGIQTAGRAAELAKIASSKSDVKYVIVYADLVEKNSAGKDKLALVRFESGKIVADKRKDVWKDLQADKKYAKALKKNVDKPVEGDDNQEGNSTKETSTAEKKPEQSEAEVKQGEVKTEEQPKAKAEEKSKSEEKPAEEQPAKEEPKADAEKQEEPKSEEKKTKMTTAEMNARRKAKKSNLDKIEAALEANGVKSEIAKTVVDALGKNKPDGKGTGSVITQLKNGKIQLEELDPLNLDF